MVILGHFYPTIFKKMVVTIPNFYFIIKQAVCFK